ncbi:hypothetical protein HGO38_06565 [Rhizobium sp. CG5]|nr:hypothetical protein [Rhizobium sp. CG5]
MMTAFPRSLVFIPVCSQAGSRLAAFSVGRAERAEKAEGKIKETGTMSVWFQGKPLSAHCLGEPRAAPWFWTPRAACPRKALALQSFDRHSSPNSGVFRLVGPEAHP